MKKQISWFFIFVFIIGFCAYSQKPNEKKSESFAAVSSKEKPSDLNEMSEELRQTDVDRAILYAQEAYYKAEKSKDFPESAKAMENLGEAYIIKGEYNIAIRYFQTAHQKYVSSGSNIEAGLMLSNIAKIKNWQGKYDEAINVSFLAIRFFQPERYYFGIGRSYNTIGIAYDQNAQYEKAKYYYNKALQIFYNIQDTMGVANALNNMAIVYGKEDRLEESLTLFEKSLELNRQLQNIRLLSPILNNIGIIHKTQGNFAQAEKCFFESKQINIEVNNTRGLFFSYVNIASLYIETEELEKALLYNELSTQLALQMEALPELVDCYLNYSKIYEKKGDYKNAFEYHKLYKETSDKLQKDIVAQNIKEIEEKFQYKAQESEFEIQKKDNAILRLELGKSLWYKNFILGVLISVVALLVMFIYQYRSKKKYNEYLEALNTELQRANALLVESESKMRELNLTRDKFFSIISHDLRNPVASLVSFVRVMKRDFNSMKKQEIFELVEEMKNTTEKAQDLLENLLLWTRTQTGKIKYYPEKLDLQAICNETMELFKGDIAQKQISLQVFLKNPPEIYGDANMIKSILRNLVSNSIKFTNHRGTVKISLTDNLNFDILTIEDDGIGMNEEDVSSLFVPGGIKSKRGTADEKGSGIGLLICHEFMDKHHGFIDVSSMIGKGTIFRLYFPKNQKD